jgi:hypothetical protein
MAEGDQDSDPPVESNGSRTATPDVISLWRLPVFGHKLRNMPAFLVPTLSNMATQVPDTRLGYRISYERAHALLVLASVARTTDPAALVFDEPASAAERELGFVIGQAFHQGWPLADVAFAAGIPADQVVAIGQRTIRRKGWLKRL